MGNLKGYIRLLRVQQWIKNLIVFAPLFFSGSLFDKGLMAQTTLAFLTFCLLSSSVYCFNDIKDKAKDRLHPTKRYRPIASGSVSVVEGYVLMGVCVAASFLLIMITLTDLWLMLILIGYYMMSIAYCLWLKKIAIVDVTCIAIDFVLRILAGGIATGIYVSQWLLLMTYLLAIFLALSKRYDDLLITEKTGEQLRSSIMGYSRNFVSVAMTTTASVMLVCYVMYTMSPEVTSRLGTKSVLLTSFWVITAVLRFMQVTFVFNNSGSPTRIVMNDHFIWICLLGWIMSFFLLIYYR